MNKAGSNAGNAVCMLAFVAALLCSCATPKPILDLAEQETVTVGLAEVSLRDYLNSTNAQLGARMELLRLDAQARARELASREMDAVFGHPVSTPAAELIRQLGEGYRTIQEKEARELERLSKELALDSSTLAKVPSEKFTTARGSFTVLAQELSPEEWVKLSIGYAKAISDGMKATRKNSADENIGED